MNHKALEGWAARDLSCARRLHAAAAKPLLQRLLILVSRAGDGPLWFAAILLLPWIAPATGTACALRMALMGAGNLLLYLALKHCCARQRPYVQCTDIRACTPSMDRYSFPSGHTLHAVAYTIVLSSYYAPLLWILAPFTVLLALSRVVLGLHYPSDVLGGVLIGTASAIIALNCF